MEADSRVATERLHHFLEHASAVDSLVARLVMSPRDRDLDQPLVVASGRELDAVRKLVVAGGASEVGCALALDHLGRLESLLRLAVAEAAERTYTLADRIAIAEEFEPDEALDRCTSARAVALGDELAALR